MGKRKSSTRSEPIGKRSTPISHRQSTGSHETLEPGNDRDFSNQKTDQKGLGNSFRKCLCKKSHPGGYCQECALGEAKKGANHEYDDGDENDSSERSSSAEENDSMGNDWDEIEDEVDMDDLFKNVNAKLDAAAAKIEESTAKKLGRIPIGLLSGRWDLWHLDEQRFKDHDRYGMLRLEITDEAVTGELLGKGRSFFRTGEVPLEAFMQWTFMDEYCGIVPFKLPTCASLKAIPAILNYAVEGVARGGLDVKCEIIFLGDNLLRLRVPAASSIGSLFNGGSDGMIEFGGERTRSW